MIQIKFKRDIMCAKQTKYMIELEIPNLDEWFSMSLYRPYAYYLICNFFSIFINPSTLIFKKNSSA